MFNGNLLNEKRWVLKGNPHKHEGMTYRFIKIYNKMKAELIETYKAYCSFVNCKEILLFYDFINIFYFCFDEL